MGTKLYKSHSFWQISRMLTANDLQWVTRIICEEGMTAKFGCVMVRNDFPRRSLHASRISSLPSTTPDADFPDLRQGLIVALGRLAAAYDRRWHRRRRVLDTLPVILFVFALVCARR